MTAARKYNADQLMKVVLAPVVSEKSTFVAGMQNWPTFLKMPWNVSIKSGQMARLCGPTRPN